MKLFELPNIAIGDVLGSSMFNILIIALLDVVSGPTPIAAKAHQGQVLAAGFGVLLHVRGIALPSVELVVAATVLVAGVAVASGQALRSGGWNVGWAVLFAVAGLFHGYAFGETIFGAEPTPLAAYLTGLVVIQSALAAGIALVARRFSASAVEPRLAGAAVAGIGLAVLAGQLIPA